ncbi:MAG: hypothetical protein US49_C0001G0248 [candidate division TM6 bacterium GW2011_GWF2_37_49]|nr:MAG: hypothetical protein US49_C0001G0248 [candidate division TM6 bacterium GW2011_GWF2_37_49]
MRFMSKTFCIFLFIASSLFDLKCNLAKWTKSCFTKHKEYVALPGIYSATSAISSKQFRSKMRMFQLISSLDVDDSDANRGFIQKIKIPTGSNVCIIGDIHGSIHSLLRNLWRLVFLKTLNNNLKIIKKNFYLIFLGDYVDRGPCSVEVLATLIDLKMMNWDKVFLLRGNHENTTMNMAYGFFDELQAKTICSLTEVNDNFYKYLPYALFVGSGADASFVQFCHGGIEPSLKEALKIFLEEELLEGTHSMRIFPEDMGINNCFNLMDFLEEAESYGQNPDTLRPYVGCDCAVAEFADYGIGAIFRGHQHSFFGMKIGGERHWSDFIRNDSEFLLSQVKWPIFTFSTAAEIGTLPYDCLGILTTADKLKNWKLGVYEYLLPDSRDDKFVSITKADFETDDLFKINWSEIPPKSIIYEELLKKSFEAQEEIVLGVSSIHSQRKLIEDKRRKLVIFDKKGGSNIKHGVRTIKGKDIG